MAKCLMALALKNNNNNNKRVFLLIKSSCEKEKRAADACSGTGKRVLEWNGMRLLLIWGMCWHITTLNF